MFDMDTQWTLYSDIKLYVQFQSLSACEDMSAILAMEGNNTASTDAIENAGKQIILVTGSVLGGAVMSSKTTNATEVRVIQIHSLSQSNDPPESSDRI